MKAVATRVPDASIIESVIIQGDLSKLSPAQSVSYYNQVCESVGLNPLTKPFEYLTLNGKKILYARRDATDQLRKIHRVSIKIVSREVLGDVYVVTAQASMADGRVDESTGAVSIAGLKGDMMANAYLKCETKAKRRVTLSICGLSLLDETEVETIRHVNQASPTKANQVNQLLSPSPDVDLEVEIEPDFVTEAAAGEPASPGDYIIPIGKQYRGKRLSEVALPTLKSFAQWVVDKIEHKNEDTIMFLKMVDLYVKEQGQ